MDGEQRGKGYAQTPMALPPCSTSDLFLYLQSRRLVSASSLLLTTRHFRPVPPPIRARAHSSSKDSSPMNSEVSRGSPEMRKVSRLFKHLLPTSIFFSLGLSGVRGRGEANR